MPPDDSAAPAPAPSPELEAVAAKIEAGAADAPPPGAQSAPGAELPDVELGMSREDADVLARLGVDWIAAAVVRQYPVLVYPEETRARAARLAGAVLVKYDVMKWAGRWRAEFELGAFLAGVAWQSYQVIVQSRNVTAQDAGGAGESHNPAA